MGWIDHILSVESNYTTLGTFGGEKVLVDLSSDLSVGSTMWYKNFEPVPFGVSEKALQLPLRVYATFIIRKFFRMELWNGSAIFGFSDHFRTWQCYRGIWNTLGWRKIGPLPSIWTYIYFWIGHHFPVIKKDSNIREIAKSIPFLDVGVLPTWRILFFRFHFLCLFVDLYFIYIGSKSTWFLTWFWQVGE